MKKLIFLLLIFIAGNVNAQVSRNIKYVKNLNPRPSQPLSQFGSKYASVWGWTAPNGREYAILCCVTGTSFVDITDTNNVVECDFVAGSNTPWREAKTYQNYAYIVTDNMGNGMQIIDMSYLPDSVRLVKTWTATGFTQAHTITSEGRYMYLSGGNASSNGGIRILDLLDPINPVRRGQYTTRYVHDCYVKNDTIYGAAMFSNRYVILDARNKDSIKLIKEFQNLPNYSLTHNLWTTDDRKYMITTDESQNPPGAVKLWNIQNYDNITYVNIIRPSVPANSNSIGHNVFIKGKLLIVSHYESGIRFYDISNLPTVNEIAYYDTYPSADSAEYRGNWGAYPFFASGKIISSDMQTGLWITIPDTTVTSAGSNSSLVPDFKLNQNYPNPFNPETKISFSIPKSDFVTLEIFDALGRKIETLMNKETGAGNYDINWNANDLSGGVYFYKLTTSQFSDTKRMILIK
ncbi:MAG TPA: hypothetical protein DIS94_09925 [Bacteroidetes bacterium]|nr:hypothetical protein [Bacteroidota bacterium]